MQQKSSYSKKNKTANLFWMGKLTNYELVCIESFYKKGFETILWTYEPNHKSLDSIHENIIIKNAEEIVPKTYLGKFTQNNQKNNLSSFSNYFRYKLLTKNGGWWFDTDCYCLKTVEEFIKLSQNRNIVIGKTRDNLVNGSVIFLNDKNLFIDLIEYIENKLIVEKYNFYWGEIGPYLLTEYLKNNNNVLPPKFFYEINPNQFHFIFDSRKNKKITVYKTLEDSYVLHFWNEMLRRFLINKSKLPPKNSYIFELFFDNQTSNKKQYGPLMFLRFTKPVSLIYKIISRMKVIFNNILN